MRPLFRLARGIVLRPAKNEFGFEVLRGRYTDGRSEGLFTFPGGQVEEAELSLQTAIREVKEETGLETTRLFRRHPPIQEYPSDAGNMVIHYHLLVVTGGTLQNTPELDFVAFVKPDTMLYKHANGRRQFLDADISAWEQVRKHELLPGMANFYPRIGYWPRRRMPKLALPALPPLVGGAEPEPASAA